MSPVAKRRGGGHTGRAVAVALVGVLLALGTAYLIATLASNGDVQVRLGDDRFDAGKVERLARIIDDDGQPILFPDPATFSRSIYIDHTGTSADQGWVALSAFIPEQPECTLTFDPDRGTYVITDQQPASCDRSATFPRSGAGLRLFPTEVVDGHLYVDLRPGEQ